MLKDDKAFIKPGSPEQHKHKKKINTKTKHDISSETCEDKARFFLCFIFCSALGLCFDSDLMLMLTMILMSQAWLHSFVLLFVLSLCLCSHVDQALTFLVKNKQTSNWWSPECPSRYPGSTQGVTKSISRFHDDIDTWYSRISFIILKLYFMWSSVNAKYSLNIAIFFSRASPHYNYRTRSQIVGLGNGLPRSVGISLHWIPSPLIDFFTGMSFLSCLQARFGGKICWCGVEIKDQELERVSKGHTSLKQNYGYCSKCSSYIQTRKQLVNRKHIRSQIVVFLTNRSVHVFPTIFEISGMHVTSMTAILGELPRKNLINFYCMWNEHGRRNIVLWILRNWLQPIYTDKSCPTSFVSSTYFFSGICYFLWNGHT